MNLRCPTNNNRQEDSLRCIFSRRGHLLRHVHHNIVSNQRQGTLKKTEDPGDSIGVSNLIREVCEDKVCRVLVRGGKNDDGDDYAAQDGPVHC